MLNRLSILVGALVVLMAPLGAMAEPLPTRDDVLDARLGNGLRYIIAPHDASTERTVLRLLVRAGAIDERDHQRGAAHFIQHMAFLGSKRFPAGSARTMFQSLGMELDRHENAYSAFDYTVYTLILPASSDLVLEKGFTFLSDVLNGLTFPESAVETERSVLLEELRQYDTPEQRVFQNVLNAIAPDERLSKGFPIGAEDSIATMTREQCLDFYHEWYTPENATLLVVGDVKESRVQSLIERHFGTMPPRKSPERMPVEIKPFDAPHSIVLTDPELVRGVVAALAVSPVRPAAQTIDAFRDQLIDQLVRQLMKRRLERRSFEGEASYAASGAYFGNVFGAMWIGQIVLAGPSDRWEGMHKDLIEELNRASEYGFSETELALARDTLLAEAGAIARSEPTLPPASIMGLLTESVVSSSPLVSSVQNLALLEQLLPEINAAEASERFRERFNPDHTAIVAELGPEVDHPTEAQLVNRTKRLAQASVEALDPPILLDALMTTPPSRGDLDFVTLDADSGVLSMQFGNGVIAHHRSMPESATRVTIRLTIAGGEIEENSDTRGLTQAGAVVFDRLATPTIAGMTIRDFIASRGVSMRARVGLDAVTVEIESPLDQVESAFQLLHLALMDPLIEEAAIDDWRQRQSARAITRNRNPGRMIESALVDTIYPPDESRVRPLSLDDIDRVDAASAQQWLRDLLARAPLEVSVVGGLDRGDAADLLSRYLGSLPKRSVMRSDALAERRQVERAPAPHVRTVEVDTQSDQAMVVIGFFGPNAGDRDDVRALEVAERIIRPQLVRRLRDELGLVSSVKVTNRPAQALPGFGIFLVVAPTSPGHASRVADMIERHLESLALGGPGQTDVAMAQAQLAADAKDDLPMPDHWSKSLSDLTYRGRTLGELTSAPLAHQDVDASLVREAFATRLAPENRIRVIILPRED